MSYRLENLNILCIDDNKYMQQIYLISLSSMGFRDIKFAAEGGEALECLQTSNFDLVFCDLNMAPVDGIEFVKTVRRMTDTSFFNIPIIMVSGNTEVSNVIEARDAGATEFLAKPISVEELYRRIYAVIENPREHLETDEFAGPDRRRRLNPELETLERRAQKLAKGEVG